MEPYEIKYHLAKNGSSPKEIAEICGVSPVSISYVMSGRTVSSRIRKAISRTIGIPEEDIWPTANVTNNIA